MTQETEHTLTVDDVAADLRVTREAVMVMARGQEIPFFKVGRYWRITASGYSAWKARQETPPKRRGWR